MAPVSYFNLLFFPVFSITGRARWSYTSCFWRPASGKDKMAGSELVSTLPVEKEIVI
jgi:hypothetical protein